MYVCLCAQVTDRQWQSELAQANNDWLSASAATGAGLGCGGCRGYLRATTASSPTVSEPASPRPTPCPLPVLAS